MEKIQPWATVCIKLLQGPIYRNNNNDPLWTLLDTWQSDIQRYFAVIGLKVVIDNSDGYAFLSQIDSPDDKENNSFNDETNYSALPKLIKEYPLSPNLSLLCVILREALDQFDASENQSVALVMKQSEIRDRLSSFIPETSDQSKVQAKLDSYLTRLCELTFLRELTEEQTQTFPGEIKDRTFEVRRIIRSKINAEFMEEFKNKLQELTKDEAE